MMTDPSSATRTKALGRNTGALEAVAASPSPLGPHPCTETASVSPAPVTAVTFRNSRRETCVRMAMTQASAARWIAARIRW